MPETLPLLTPVELDDCLLSFSCGAWELPRSGFTVPVIEFTPPPGTEPGMADLAERGRRFIRFRCREIVDVVEPAHGLLIDLGALPAALLQGLDPVPEKTRWLAEPVRIVVGTVENPDLAGSVASHELVATRQQAMSELAFALRHHRSDGGAKLTKPGPVPPPRVLPVTLDVSALALRCFTWRIPTSGRTGGLVEITGQYRHGSAGSDDALVIRWRSSQLCEAVEPAALIVDLRSFEYAWGDDLSLYPPRFPGPESPIRFIVRPGQQESLKGELYPQSMVFDEVSALRELS